MAGVIAAAVAVARVAVVAVVEGIGVVVASALAVVVVSFVVPDCFPQLSLLRSKIPPPRF